MHYESKKSDMKKRKKSVWTRRRKAEWMKKKQDVCALARTCVSDARLLTNHLSNTAKAYQRTVWVSYIIECCTIFNFNSFVINLMIVLLSSLGWNMSVCLRACVLTLFSSFSNFLRLYHFALVHLLYHYHELHPSINGFQFSFIYLSIFICSW